MPTPFSQRSSAGVPLVLRVLTAPALGLLFLVTLPLAGLAAIGWGLARRHPETPARPAGDLGPGHQGPRAARREAGTPP
jgi:hypothetical protein